MEPTEYTVVVTDTTRDARDLLTEASGLSAGRVSAAMAAGAVWLRTQHGIRRLRRRSAKLSEGDQLFLNYDESVLAQTTASAEQRESFIVHRLDLAARGLMLLAHDKKTAAHLSGQFADRTVGKRYHAIVHGKYPTQPETQQYLGDINGKAAETQATRVRFDPDTSRSVLLVSIKTGRKHQIRRHLADAGFPIVGDRLYGKEGDSEDLCLVASRLTFADPLTGTRVKCECIPEEWL